MSEKLGLEASQYIYIVSSQAKAKPHWKGVVWAEPVTIAKR